MSATSLLDRPDLVDRADQPTSASVATRRARVLAAARRLTPIFQQVMTASHAPGLAYGVVLDGELLYTWQAGVRDVATQAPVHAGTVFRIASMTKSFTALAILQLRDAGRLRLDDMAATYVPELATLTYPTVDSPAITVRHLLTMTAGLPQDDPWADRQLYRADDWLSELLRNGISWSNPPGLGFEYSNLGYMILGRIIANVSGVPTPAYITRHILQPLGMHDTVWDAADVPPDRLAHGYTWLDDAWHPQELLPTGGDVGAFGGLFTTLADLARWVGLFQTAWSPVDDAPSGQELLSPATRREMQQISSVVRPVIAAPEPGQMSDFALGGYGFGLSINQHHGWESVGHSGGLPGFGSNMRWAPAYGVGIIGLTNATYSGVGRVTPRALAHLITDAKLATQQPQPAPSLVAVYDNVNRLLAGWDDALADQLFADNFFLDLDRAHWQAQLNDLSHHHGAIQSVGALAAENRLRGAWQVHCARGDFTVWLSLTPTVPLLVQAMTIDSRLPLTEAAQAVVDKLAALVSHPTRRGLHRLCGRAAEREAVWNRVRMAHILCGRCRPTDEQASADTASVHVRLVGDNGAMDVDLQLDDRGKLLDAHFRVVVPAIQ